MFLDRFGGKKHIHSYTEASLFPVLSANDLLAGAKHQKVLSKIKSSIDIPEQHFDQLYKELIKNFAEYVQAMPTFDGGPMGGMLNDGLTRALYAIEISQERQYDQEDYLLIYVLFSSALLLEVANVTASRRVMISDQYGAFVEEWSPYAGPMSDAGKFYKVRPTTELPLHLQTAITVFLAEKIMPELGFKWISENTRLFDLWVALLTDVDEGTSGPGLVHSLIKERRKADIESGTTLLPELKIEFTHPKQTALGEAFYHWLKQSVNNPNFQINTPDAHMHLVREGIFVESPFIFEDFLHGSKETANWSLVSEQFNLLGLTRGNNFDFKSQQYFSTYMGDEQRNLGSTPGKVGIQPELNTSFKGGPNEGMQTTQTNTMRQGFVIPRPDLMFITAQAPKVTSNLVAAQQTPKAAALPKLDPPPKLRPLIPPNR